MSQQPQGNQQGPPYYQPPSRQQPNAQPALPFGQAQGMHHVPPFPPQPASSDGQGIPALEITSNIPGGKPTSYGLIKPVINIGRDPSNDIVIDTPVVSSFHAQIVREGNQLILVHPHPSRSQTTNGLLYQGRHILGNEPFRKPLVRGDIFRIGNEHGAFVTLAYNDGNGAPQAGVPVTTFVSHPQPSISPQSHMPQQSFTPPPTPQQLPKRRATLGLGQMAGVGSVLGSIAALLAILQFLGVTNFWGIFHQSALTPGPTPLPVIRETSYDAMSPVCASHEPSDIAWYSKALDITCPTDNSGTQLNQTSNQYVALLELKVTSNKYRLASDETVGVTFTNLANNVCAGIGTRQNLRDNGFYGFFICGDGDWYIFKYSRQGLPTVLTQSTSSTKEDASDHYDMVVTVNGNNLQMIINGTGQVHAAQDSDYVLAQGVSLLLNEEVTLTSYKNADFLSTVIVKNFHYGQL